MKKDENINEYLEMYSNFQRIEEYIKKTEINKNDEEIENKLKILRNNIFGSNLKKQNNKETKEKIKKYMCLLEEELGLSVSYDFEEIDEKRKLKTR